VTSPKWQIVAHTLTDQDAGDVSQVAPLLDQIGGPIGQFTADGAKPTYDAVIDHSEAAAIVIPPRANAVEPSDDRPRGLRRQSADTSPSSGGVCGPGRCLVSRPSRHRLRRPQPHACLRTPESRPPQGSHAIVSRFNDPHPFSSTSVHQRPIFSIFDCKLLIGNSRKQRPD